MIPCNIHTDKEREMSEELEDGKIPIDFDLFHKTFGVRIIGLTFRCTKCERRWGISVWDEKTVQEINEDKLVCNRCKRTNQHQESAGTQETLPISK
jgi:hypothetical protein